MLKKVALSVALLLVVGSWALTGCGGSEPSGLEDGPGMLYFHATW